MKLWILSTIVIFILHDVNGFNDWDDDVELDEIKYDLIKRLQDTIKRSDDPSTVSGDDDENGHLTDEEYEFVNRLLDSTKRWNDGVSHVDEDDEIGDQLESVRRNDGYDSYADEDSSVDDEWEGEKRHNGYDSYADGDVSDDDGLEGEKRRNGLNSYDRYYEDNESNEDNLESAMRRLLDQRALTTGSASTQPTTGSASTQPTTAPTTAMPTQHGTTSPEPPQTPTPIGHVTSSPESTTAPPIVEGNVTSTAWNESSNMDQKFMTTFGLVDYVMNNYGEFPNEIRQANVSFKNLTANITPIFDLAQRGRKDRLNYRFVLSAIGRFLALERMACPDVVLSRILFAAVGAEIGDNPKYDMGGYLVNTVIPTLTNDTDLIKRLGWTLQPYLQGIYAYTGRYILMEYNINAGRDLLIYLSHGEGMKNFVMGKEKFASYLSRVWSYVLPKLRCGTIEDYSHYLKRSIPQLLVRVRSIITSSALKMMNERLPTDFFMANWKKLVGEMTPFLKRGARTIGKYMKLAARKEYDAIVNEQMKESLEPKELKVIEDLFVGLSEPGGVSVDLSGVLSHVKKNVVALQKLKKHVSKLDVPASMKKPIFDIIKELLKRHLQILKKLARQVGVETPKMPKRKPKHVF